MATKNGPRPLNTYRASRRNEARKERHTYSDKRKAWQPAKGRRRKWHHMETP